MSQSLRTQPSAILRTSNTFAAFCIDRAVFTFGTIVESDMQEAEENTKTAKAAKAARAAVLDKWLNVSKKAVGRFADPALKF